MPLCLLCKQKEATAENSHLIPFSLVNTSTNKDGVKERDYELTYGLSENDFVDSFFGRNITEDTIKKYKGRELTQEEIKKKNPFTRDFMLCPSCEKNIGRLESYFASNILQKLKKGNFGTPGKDSKGNIIANFDKVDAAIVLLFVYSIFFRCSIGRYHGFRLDIKIEEKMRKTLLYYLQENINEVKDKIHNEPKKFEYYPVVSTFSQVDPLADTTENFVTISHSKLPYFIYINQVSFQLFTKNRHIGNSVQFFYGIKEMIEPFRSVIRLNPPVPVIILDIQKGKKVKLTAFEFISRAKLNFFKRGFRRYHKNIFHRQPPEDLVQYFVSLIINAPIPVGEKYTKESVFHALIKACKDYYHITK